MVEGLVGNYPNFFFRVADSGVSQFVDDLAGIDNREDFGRFVDTYGVRRTSPSFWAMSDWFNDRLAERRPIEAGVLDLNRYENL